MDRDPAPRPLEVVDLGRIAYAPARERQLELGAEVIRARETGRARVGFLLLLEHDPPVITVTKRPGAADHLLAGREELDGRGVTVAHTDRGGDITYHGPGQLVAYPILDLNLLALGLHDYVRTLEQSAIDACAAFGVGAGREPEATGVWEGSGPAGAAKICAIGVRVRRWVSYHGLALNVDPDLSHFELIVPCGLAGRTVTSLSRLLGARAPSMAEAKSALAQSLSALVEGRLAQPDRARASGRRARRA